MTEEEFQKAKFNYKTSYWRTLWRPFIAWTYGLVCMFDFVISPMVYFLVQIFYGIPPEHFVTHTPLTLQGGGLYHLSMLAIVGVTSFGRTKEKIAGVSSDLNTKADELLKE